MLDILNACFDEADAGGFRAFQEAEPEIFTEEAIEATRSWLMARYSAFSLREKKRKGCRGCGKPLNPLGLAMGAPQKCGECLRRGT